MIFVIIDEKNIYICLVKHTKKQMKKLILILIIICFFITGSTQENSDYLLWNSKNKLTINDFGIKKSDSYSESSFAQFTMEYEVKGLNFLTKNFNKKVKTLFIKSASWINPLQDVELSLRYQQTLFDLYEIYTRRFRKELSDNRKQFIKGLSFVKEIDSKIMADLSKRRLQYDSETKNGKDNEKQAVWEQQIKQELDELSDFDYNN
jgi:hypothetical protein